MDIEVDIHGNPICGQDFMAGTICSLPPDHEGFHRAICQGCGRDWYIGECRCVPLDDDEDDDEDLPDLVP